VPAALPIPEGLEAAVEFVRSPALTEDHLQGDVLGVSREVGGFLLLFFLFFLLFLFDVGSFDLGELTAVAAGGLAPLLGLGPQFGELLLGHFFRGGEELVVLRDLGVGHGFFAVRYGGVG